MFGKQIYESGTSHKVPEWVSRIDQEDRNGLRAGKRWHKSLKSECIRPGTPLSLDDARRLVQGYVEHYNNIRLNSAIGYITPRDMLAGRQQVIHTERDRKLAAARQQRRLGMSEKRIKADKAQREADLLDKRSSHRPPQNQGKKPREDFNQAAVRIVEEAAEKH